MDALTIEARLSELEADGPGSPHLIAAARKAGLYAMEFQADDECPRVVFTSPRKRADAEALGRRLVLAMREVVRPDDGHDDPAGAVIGAAVALTELYRSESQPAPAAFRAAMGRLLAAVEPYECGERPWDEVGRRMVLTNVQRAWIREWANDREVAR